jgi:transposase
MKRFVEGADRVQATLLPECLDDWIDEENPVRAIDAFADVLDLKQLGFPRSADLVDRSRQSRDK